jgi:hypothetical protein
MWSRAYLQDLRGRQFSEAVPLAGLGRAVNNFICGIAFSRIPSKVTRIDAGTNSAVMRDFML